MDLLQEKRYIMKLVKILKQPRVIILIIFLILSYIAINYQFSKEGVAISSVEMNSSAYSSGLRSPSSDASLTSRERILQLNTQQINSVQEFYEKESLIPVNGTIRIITSVNQYT